jgi:hypothetical protein
MKSRSFVAILLSKFLQWNDLTSSPDIPENLSEHNSIKKCPRSYFIMTNFTNKNKVRRWIGSSVLDSHCIYGHVCYSEIQYNRRKCWIMWHISTVWGRNHGFLHDSVLIPTLYQVTNVHFDPMRQLVIHLYTYIHKSAPQIWFGMFIFFNTHTQIIPNNDVGAMTCQ